MAVMGTALFRAIADFGDVVSESRKASRAMEDVTDAAGDPAKESKTRRFAGTIAKWGKAAGVAAVAAGGLFLGKAITSGAQRLQTIEDATAAMTIQLGSAEAAATLLDEIMSVVTGTPYNFDSFAAAGATLAGFGAPIEKIPGYLTAIGEAAATKGARAQEFADRLATSFGRATVMGSIGRDVINDLGDVGVDALSILANHFGITTVEADKLVRNGLIPAEEGIDILTKGIMEGSDGVAGATVKFGGTMEALRETMSGAKGGFASAIARFGANILTPFVGWITWGYRQGAAALDLIGGAFLSFANLIQETGQRIWTNVRATWERVAEALDLNIDFGSSWGRLEQVWESLRAVGQPLWAIVESLAEAFVTASTAIGVSTWQLLLVTLEIFANLLDVAIVPALQWLADLMAEHQGVVTALVGAYTVWKTITTAVKVAQWALNAAMAANPIGLVIAAVLALVAGLVWFFTQTELGRQIWETVWNAIKVAAQAVVDWWTNTAWPALVAGWDAIQAAAQAVANWWNETLVPLFQAAWDSIKAAAEAVGEWYNTHLAPTFEAFVGLMSALWDTLVSYWEWGWGVISGIFDLWKSSAADTGSFLSSIWDGLKAAWDVLWGAIQSAWTAIGEPVVEAIKAAWEILKDYATMVWNGIKIAVETALGAIREIVQAVTAIIQGDWSRAWEHIKNAFAIVGQGIMRLGEQLWNFLKSLFNNGLTILKSLWNVTWTWIKNLTSSIWNGIKSLVSSAFNAVRNTISSVLNGIKSLWNAGWNAVKNFVTNAWRGIKSGVQSGANNMLSFIRSIPGKILSALGNLGSLLVNSGKALLRGFTDGIRAGFNNALSAVSNGLGRLRNLWPFSPAKEGPFSGRGYLTYSGKAMMEDFGDAIVDEEGALIRKVSGVLASAKEGFSGIDLLGQVTPTEMGATHVVQKYTPQATETESRPMVGELVVNNPVAEPASDTLARVVRRRAYVGWA